MKFKIGDKVRIKPKLKVRSSLNELGIIEDMLVYCGNVFTVEKVRKNSYELRGIKFLWDDDMVEDPGVNKTFPRKMRCYGLDPNDYTDLTVLYDGRNNPDLVNNSYKVVAVNEHGIIINISNCMEIPKNNVITSEEIVIEDAKYNLQGEPDRIGKMYGDKLIKKGLSDSFEVRDAFEDGMATILNMSLEKIIELKNR